MKIKVCILTSVHPPFDVRIFHKEAKTLVKAGYDVTLIAQHDKEEIVDGVKIINLQRPRNRIERMTKTVCSAYKKAVQLDADIYHFHDPELIPVGMRLKRMGKTVVFDSHEDVPKQLLGKPYLKKPAKIFLSRCLELYEKYSCRRFDAIVAATPFIRDKFLKINPNTVDINNFPMIGELASGQVDWSIKQNHVCYVGGIGTIRGIEEMVKAMALVKAPARLQLGGLFDEQVTEARITAVPSWGKIDALGFLDRKAVRDVLARSMAGLVTLHPIVNYINALPVKMFEYMVAGIPVIASSFPLWQEIIEGNECGLCVDPLNPSEIAKAIDYILTHPEEAQRMGQNGLRAVKEQYNWDIEEKKLLALYEQLLLQKAQP
jgi:glycosyltransferase involved in cell wall biosynthesis